jgi:hypothetical protein
MSGVRIVEMFKLAMKLNEDPDCSGLDQTFIEIGPTGSKRRFIFTPIRPHDVLEFKRVYDLEIELATKA